MLNPNEVSILYFESQREFSEDSHPDGWTSTGISIDVPESYRYFFMLETDRLLGFSDD